MAMMTTYLSILVWLTCMQSVEASSTHKMCKRDALPQRDVVAWAAIMSAYIQQGEASKALQLYGQMKTENGVIIYLIVCIHFAQWGRVVQIRTCKCTHLGDTTAILIGIYADNTTVQQELEFVNLIKLKLVPGQVKAAQPQPFISRRSAGLCFDFLLVMTGSKL